MDDSEVERTVVICGSLIPNSSSQILASKK